MLRTRRAAKVLAAAVLAWLAATVLAVACLLSAYLADPSSHAAEDATLGMVILSPQLLVATLGVVVLHALWTERSRAAALGIAWGILQVLVGLAMSWRLLTLLASLVTEGRRIAWDASEAALAFTTTDGADFTHWTDWAGMALLVVAIVGLVAAEILALTPREDRPAP